MASEPERPFGERLTWPSPASGAVATKKTGCRSMKFRSRPPIRWYSLPIADDLQSRDMRRYISEFRNERNIRARGDQLVWWRGGCHAGGGPSCRGPVVGSILRGSAVYQVEGQPEAVLWAGDAFFEPEGERIARFDATDEGVTFLGYFLLAPGQDASITMLDQ